MGKIDAFHVELQKPQPIYLGGETLVGCISIQVRERLKINSVYLTILGESRVRWTEQRNNGKSSYTVVFSSVENYMNMSVPLLSNQSKEDLYLEAGHFRQTFEIVLPPNLPTSFEHKIGKIRYSIRACIDIPWSLNKYSERGFTVISHFDLNLNPHLRSPNSNSGEKILGFGPWKSDPIVGKIQIPKVGFVPGENLPFEVTIENNSNKRVKEAKLTLRQNIEFRGRGEFHEKIRKESRVMSCLVFPREINEKTTERWQGFISISPVVATSNGLCRNITVSYSLVLNINPAGLHTSQDVFLPVVIATIPFVENNQNQMTNNYQSNNLQPPSYRECGFEGYPNLADPDIKGEVYQSVNEHFKPIYPFYSYPDYQAKN